MEEQEKKYILGFNNGYLLAKYEPGLMAKIIKDLRPSDDYLTGFFSGKQEYEQEHERGQLSELEQLRNKSRDREQGLDIE